ncbi:hypothetical protein, partial [Dokdonella sp.]|uniref:hypothetical protein n=1 Tax=Dokdonella sp. TaxID=2291710 RepID=UPI002DD69D34
MTEEFEIEANQEFDFVNFNMQAKEAVGMLSQVVKLTRAGAQEAPGRRTATTLYDIEGRKDDDEEIPGRVQLVDGPVKIWATREEAESIVSELNRAGTVVRAADFDDYHYGLITPLCKNNVNVGRGTLLRAIERAFVRELRVTTFGSRLKLQDDIEFLFGMADGKQVFDLTS